MHYRICKPSLQAERLIKQIVHCQVTLQPHQGKLCAKLYALGVVKSEKTNDDGTRLLELEIQQHDF